MGLNIADEDEQAMGESRSEEADAEENRAVSPKSSEKLEGDPESDAVSEQTIESELCEATHVSPARARHGSVSSERSLQSVELSSAPAAERVSGEPAYTSSCEGSGEASEEVKTFMADAQRIFNAFMRSPEASRAIEDMAAGTGVIMCRHMPRG